MGDLFKIISDHGGEIYTFLTSVIAAASVIANLTRTDKDNKVVGKLDSLVHILALNFFAIKNPDDSKLNK